MPVEARGIAERPSRATVTWATCVRATSSVVEVQKCYWGRAPKGASSDWSMLIILRRNESVYKSYHMTQLFYSKRNESYVYTKTFTWTLVAAQFTIAKRWTQPRCLSVDKWSAPIQWILFSHKKERSTDTLQHEWTSKTLWKKPDTKSHILCCSIDMKYLE